MTGDKFQKTWLVKIWSNVMEGAFLKYSCRSINVPLRNSHVYVPWEKLTTTPNAEDMKLQYGVLFQYYTTIICSALWIPPE